MPHEDDLSNLVNDFLKRFAPEPEEEEELEQDDFALDFDGVYHNNEIQRLQLSDYTPVSLQKNTMERVARFQQIVDGIQKNTLQHHNITLKANNNFKIDYRRSLNTGQLLAATTVNGPLLVIAGAGSGKTHTVVYRVSYLLENGVPPESILLLTFTRKAANEMIRRTTRLLKDSRAEKIMRGTYHAFANHTLRRYAPMLGLPSNYTIIDTIDSEDIIDLIRSELKFNKKSKAFPRKRRIQSIISKARNCAISITTVLENEYTGLLEFEKELTILAKVFAQYKQNNKVLDYDDLMEVLRNQLRDNKHFRAAMQQHYRYIIVDEFQDTNIVQKEIVDLIAQKHRNIMVVGDDSQSIYAFRGANFENILTFPATYPTCKVVKLEQNYRSNQSILNFTNAIANSALLGYQKNLFSTNTNLFKPVVAKFFDQQAEAEFIVNQIMRLREREIPLNHIAVLYRSSFHSNFIQTEMLKRQIPYVVVGGIKFTERRHIKDVLAYLRIALNAFDAVAWNRILKLIPGIGRVTASKLIATIQDNNGTIDFSNYSKRKYGNYLIALQGVFSQVMQPTITLATKLELIIQHYRPILKNLENDHEVRMQDTDVLHTLAARYEDVEKFLSDFALDPPSSKFQDQNRPLIDESEDKPVVLSTIHSAKGLEWYTVFVPHLLDGVFPSNRALKSIYDFEEERRLFYVACTRAKEQLYLTMPSYLNLWDSHFTKPSRFIIEVAQAHFEAWEHGTPEQ